MLAASVNRTNKLDKQLQEISIRIHAHDMINDRVSKSAVGWHIEHVLLAINRIIAALEKSNPSDYRWQFNINRLIIFKIRRIPRGRAKSPKVVLPKSFSEESLQSHLEKTRNNIKLLENIGPDKYFAHPYFGNLRLIKTVTFLEIHTDHHLRIIRDIVNAHQ